MAKHIFKCKPHVVYTVFVSTCEWTGSLDDLKITAGVPLKLASWPACLWKLGLDVFFPKEKCRGFQELLPILGWRFSTLDAKIYGNVCLWSGFLQPRQIPTPTYLLPPFAGTFFIANVETRAIPYVDLTRGSSWWASSSSRLSPLQIPYALVLKGISHGKIS